MSLSQISLLHSSKIFKILYIMHAMLFYTYTAFCSYRRPEFGSFILKHTLTVISNLSSSGGAVQGKLDPQNSIDNW